MEKSCEICNKLFKVYPSELKTKKYCSAKCRQIATGQKLRKRVIVKCKECNHEFETWPSKVGLNNFCNASCMGKYYSRKGSIQCICRNCGKTFLKAKHTVKSKNVFCSQKCGNIYKNSLRKERIQLSCSFCGASIERRPCEVSRAGRTHHFCNKSCMSEYLSQSMVGELNPCWQGGHDEYRGPNWLRQRRAAKERDKNTCQQCNANGTNADLVVHHIVPYRFFNGDYKIANKIRNLITLCRSCHSKQESHYWDTVPHGYQYLLDRSGRRKTSEKNGKAEMLIRPEGKN